MNLPENVKTVVLHFGEMARRWGFNRTVGQILALLVVNERPLSANEIAESLTISRGNVSMGIKELQSWQLVSLHHQPGDRKEYYQVAGTIWQLANRVFEERRKREIDPTLSLVRDLLMKQEAGEDNFAQQRLQEIHDLLETTTRWSVELQNMPPEKLITLMKLGAGINRILSVRDKLMSGDSTPQAH